jgi:hypothetical protein
LLATLAACSGDSKGDYVNVDSGYNTTKIYENPANKYDGGISFSTSGAWTASLVSDDGSNPSEWLTVSPMSGDKAGKYNLDLTFTANNSTIDRNAALKVNCGEASRTFYIVQRCKGSDSSDNDRTLEGFSDIVKTITLTNAHSVDSIRFYTLKTKMYITGQTLNNGDLEARVKLFTRDYDYGDKDYEWHDFRYSVTLRQNAADSDTLKLSYSYIKDFSYIEEHALRFELDNELQSAGAKALLNITFYGKMK